MTTPFPLSETDYSLHFVLSIWDLKPCVYDTVPSNMAKFIHSHSNKQQWRKISNIATEIRTAICRKHAKISIGTSFLYIRSWKRDANPWDIKSNYKTIYSLVNWRNGSKEMVIKAVKERKHLQCVTPGSLLDYVCAYLKYCPPEKQRWP